jgi:predicted enzyme related to lactoylglutathione lyase
MVSLAVDDLSAFHQSLVEKHVTCLRSPGPEEWGGLVATYADPDGNTIQLMQLPD